MAKKTKDKKKKGPKGKKARAKAKLDQVWGETYDLEERNASKVRIGKSRHQLDGVVSSGGGINGANGGKKEKDFDALAKKRRGIIPATFDDFLQRKERINNNNGYHNQRKHEAKVSASSDESSSDEDSDSDDEEMNNNGSGGYATLLKRISGVPKHKQKVSSTRDMDIDSVIETSSSSSEDESDSESSSSDEDESDNNNMNEDEESSYDSTDPTVEMNTHEDPYESHFSKRPLPEKGSSTTAITTLTQLEKHQQKLRTLPYKKVVPISTLHKSIEVQISGPLQATYNENTRARLQEAGVTEERGTDLSWNQLSLGPYNHVRQVLTRNWKSINTTKKNRKTLVGRQKIFTPYQTTVYTALARYSDVLLTNKNRINRIEINNLLSLHVVNHVLTSRTRVQRHNRRIKELSNKSNDNDDKDEGEENSDKHRDQGYTRPKVLILLPTKGVCWDFVQCMISLLGDSASVDNVERFNVEYGPLDSDNNSDEEEDVNKERRRKAVLKQKGHEWNELFGDTINSDDDFKIGMSLTPRVVKQNGKKKKSKKVNGEATSKEGEGSSSSGVNVKLFADFYHCDIILASPIGLKMATTNDEDDGNNDDDDEDQADTDFLSSIDICLVARSDVLLMQNWDHVNTILDSTLNNQPKKIDGIDFSRVRNYFLEGQAKYWRQLIVVSSFSDPYILSTFRRHANNVEGSMKIRSKVSNDDASICEVMVRTKQVFQRVTCTSVADSGSNRLRYFSEHVLPKLTRLNQKHTLIYIPSYFDFIAVRNLLLKREVNFVSVTEYARVSEVSRGRARFLQGRKSIMLYTGRAHFFLRHKIKGARHVIFFGLPEYADFYPNVVNMLSNDVADEEDEDGDITRMPMSCLSLFTKFDAHQLQRVVGTSHTENMIKGEKSSYMFSS